MNGDNMADSPRDTVEHVAMEALPLTYNEKEPIAESETLLDGSAVDKAKTSEISNETDKLSKSKRLFYTISIYASFLGLGLTASCIGPSLIDLEDVFYTDTKGIVVVFACISAGYLGGTILTGFLVEKLRDSFFFFVLTVGMAACLAASVWIRHIAVFCLFLTLMAAFQGGVDCAGQVSILKMWQHSSHKDSILQGIHFIWSVGATISPFIIEPFLSEDQKPSSQNSSEIAESAVFRNASNSSGHNQAVYSRNISQITTGNGVDELETNIQYGILTIGLVSLLMGIFCFIAFMLDGWRVRNVDHLTKDGDHHVPQTNFFKAVMIFGICWLYFFYICTEQTTGNLLATFVVDGLDWEKFKGPLITSVFWGVFGIGRVLGIVLSKLFTPTQLMYMDSSLVCVGFTVLLAMINIHEAVAWVGFAVIGLGMGSFFAAGFSFVNQHMAVDGFVSACILGASSVSSMSMTPLTGWIFATYGPMSMIYVLFTSALLVLIIFILLHVFSSRFSSTMTVITDDAHVDA